VDELEVLRERVRMLEALLDEVRDRLRQEAGPRAMLEQGAEDTISRIEAALG